MSTSCMRDVKLSLLKRIKDVWLSDAAYDQVRYLEIAPRGSEAKRVPWVAVEMITEAPSRFGLGGGVSEYAIRLRLKVGEKPMQRSAGTYSPERTKAVMLKLIAEGLVSEEGFDHYLFADADVITEGRTMPTPVKQIGTALMVNIPKLIEVSETIDLAKDESVLDLVVHC